VTVGRVSALDGRVVALHVDNGSRAEARLWAPKAGRDAHYIVELVLRLIVEIRPDDGLIATEKFVPVHVPELKGHACRSVAMGCRIDELKLAVVLRGDTGHVGTVVGVTVDHTAALEHVQAGKIRAYRMDTGLGGSARVQAVGLRLWQVILIVVGLWR
jgi:hypothetical protein